MCEVSLLPSVPRSRRVDLLAARRGRPSLLTATKGREAPSRSTRKRRNVRRAVLGDLIAIAVDQASPISVGTDTASAMQQCLDRACALWKFAADQVDKLTVETSDDGLTGFFEELPGAGGSVVVRENRWALLERSYREEIEHLAGMMTSLGIAERTVQLEEAKAVLVIAAIRDAAIEIGLDNEQVRDLGMALRTRLDSARSANPARHEADPMQHTRRASQSSAVGAAVGGLGPGHRPG